MKKIAWILLAALALFAVYTACSDPGDEDGNNPPATTYTQTQLLTGNGTVPLTTFSAANAGSYVELAISNSSGNDRSGWGIGGVGNSFSDTDILSITTTSLADGESMTAQVSVADIIAGATGADVYFNIYNDCTLDAVTLFELDE